MKSISPSTSPPDHVESGTIWPMYSRGVLGLNAFKKVLSDYRTTVPLHLLDVYDDLVHDYLIQAHSDAFVKHVLRTFYDEQGILQLSISYKVIH